MIHSFTNLRSLPGADKKKQSDYLTSVFLKFFPGGFAKINVKICSSGLGSKGFPFQTCSSNAQGKGDEDPQGSHTQNHDRDHGFVIEINRDEHG